MAKEWVQDVCNETRAKAYSHVEVQRSLGALKQEHTKLSNKLIVANRAHLSVEVGLKNVEM